MRIGGVALSESRVMSRPLRIARNLPKVNPVDNDSERRDVMSL